MNPVLSGLLTESCPLRGRISLFSESDETQFDGVERTGDLPTHILLKSLG
jgi:hypothetical protein